MDLQLHGQNIAIFGSSQGIGRAIANAFIDEGCHVRGFDRVAVDGIDTTIGDVACAQQVRDFAASFPQVNHVIYSVGVSSGKFGFPFWNVDAEDWARVLDLNLVGAVRVAQTFAPGLIASGGGSLLFLVSVAGQIGSQTDPPYSAAKAGLINFTQCAAKDLAKHQVRVNSLAPGMVKTDLNQTVWKASQQSLPESQRQSYEVWAAEKIAKVAPLGRWQMPEEYGAMACYLASPHARNITGQTINIDGGQVMHS
jgi:2-hydroxycyclohexanecarboxyl-CoA dehydrogenase